MFSKSKLKIFFSFDATLWLVLAFSLIIGYLKIIPAEPKHLILVIVAYGATVPIVIGAIRALINKKISIYLLAGIALVASLIAKQWNSVIFISLMITSARIFGDYTEDKSRAAIESLLELKPQKARVKRDGELVEIPVEELKKGDIVIVELGEKIPVDGIVEKGEAEINQSALTGESLPISKKPGDQVLSSSIVESGNLTIKTVKIGKETTFEKFIALVEQSQKNKAGIMRLSDKFAAWYIILTIIASSAIYIFTHNVYLVLGVLLVSCADDVAVALPLAFLTSMGHAAKHGAVIKGANYLEALSKIKVVVMDKTGTLTKGRLKVENIFSFGGAKPKEVAEAAAIVSVMSNHPSSQAIIRYAKEENISANEPEIFNEYAGKGATADYKNQKITSGKIAFFEELKIKIARNELEAINREKDKGLGINLIARDERMLGFFTFADEIRPEVKATITELEDLGVKKIVMLTGDNEKIAKRVANQVGIKYYHANLLPEDKLRYLKSYLSKNYKTAMIGDGVNDAAALALADVGIAMGAIGSDAAIEAADIALMRDEINQVPELIRIGKSTMKIVYQDLLIWGCVNVLGLILVFGRIFGPDGAAAYNFVTDFFPLINSLRLFR